MKFFTDKTVIHPHLLIKVKDYIKIRKTGVFIIGKWSEVFIDPGVYDLTKDSRFSWEGDINIHEFLDELPSNHYFSCDYPSDMNLHLSNLFLEKTWANACGYCYHPQYIVTVQSLFKDYLSYVKWFDRYNALDIRSGIMGIGNLCRIHFLTDFVEDILLYTFAHCRHPRIHIYGLALRCIPYANELAKKYKIELSIDSTKWTRAVTRELKDKHKMASCRKHNRQEFFDEYLKVIRSRGVPIEVI